jgi:hypothetical protein
VWIKRLVAEGGRVEKHIKRLIAPRDTGAEVGKSCEDYEHYHNVFNFEYEKAINGRPRTATPLLLAKKHTNHNSES